MFYSLPEHSYGFPSLSRTLGSNQFSALHHLLDGWTEAGQMFPGEPGAHRGLQACPGGTRTRQSHQILPGYSPTPDTLQRGLKGTV